MGIDNPSFEVKAADPAPEGDPDAWVRAQQSTNHEFADFALNPSDSNTLAQETFEFGWIGSIFDQIFIPEFEGTTLDLEASIFNPGAGQTLVEGFEKLWETGVGNSQGFFSLGSVEVAPFDGVEVETFDGWVIPPFLFVLAPADLEAALFDVANTTFEDFEDEWGDLLPVFVGIGTDLAIATFNESQVDGAGVPDDFDKFNIAIQYETETSLPRTFNEPRITAVDVANDRYIIDVDQWGATTSQPPVTTVRTIHLYVKDSGSRLPAGLQASPFPPSNEPTHYWPINVNDQGTHVEFELAAAKGGAAVPISDVGLGNFFIRPDFSGVNWTPFPDDI